jgi:transposase
MQGWAREAGHSITNVAGVDVSKKELVVAVGGLAALHRYGNDATGRRRLCRDLAKIAGTETLRVGLEASGGYERKLVMALRKAGFEVIVFQPIQVRAYAQYLGQRAKTDPIDARLIVLAAAAHDGEIRHSDDRLAPLAENLTLIEQIDEDIVRLKTRLDGFTLKAFKTKLETEIKRLTRRRNAEIRSLLKSLRQHPDLATRLELVASVEGIGERTALTLIIRMPELGTLTREEAASLAGPRSLRSPVGQDRSHPSHQGWSCKGSPQPLCRGTSRRLPMEQRSHRPLPTPHRQRRLSQESLDRMCPKASHLRQRGVGQRNSLDQIANHPIMVAQGEGLQ